jgi:subtilisin family serine protease
VSGPAWSGAFEADRLTPVTALPLGSATHEWAWEGATGAGVKVAIIDSGVDASHPLVGEVAGYVAMDVTPDGEVSATEGPHSDLVGHGTACAAIIKSIAPDVEIYSVRVLGETLKGKGVAFHAGIRWAIDAGMRVLNMSLSTKSDQWFGPLHELADEAYFKNVVMVCAANNVPGPTYPSQYASVLSVAARAGDDPMALAYNPRPPVEFGARGVDVEVAWLDGETIVATGNSFATPHVAGMVARMLSKHPELTSFGVKSVLQALADNAREE